MSGYFVVHSRDRPGGAAIRAEHRTAHRARLREHDHPIRVHVGGPLLDDAGAMIGSLLVIEADDAVAVRRFLDGDPYVVAGLYASIEILPFKWGLGAPEATGG